MTETEFREKHSKVIEHYQYIEMHLKGICAGLLADEDRGWLERLDDYASDPLGKLIQKIKDLQDEKQVILFDQQDFDELEALRKSRNYWVHQCFSDDYHVIFNKNGLKDSRYARMIKQSLQEAKEWDEKITEIGRPLLHL